MTSGQHLYCLSFPEVQIIPNPAVRCLGFALKYVETMNGRDHMSHRGKTLTVAWAHWLGRCGFSFARRDKAKSPQGTSSCCGPEPFSVTPIY